MADPWPDVAVPAPQLAALLADRALQLLAKEEGAEEKASSSNIWVSQFPQEGDSAGKDVNRDDSDPFGPFRARSLPSISLHAYLQRLVQYARPGVEALIAASVYLKRLAKVCAAARFACFHLSPTS